MQRLPELDDALQDLSEAVGERLVILDQAMRVVSYSIHETEADREALSHLLSHSDSWPTPATTGGTAWVVERVPGVGSCLFVRLVGPAHRVTGHLAVRLGSPGPPADALLRALQDAADDLGALLSFRKLRDERTGDRTQELTRDALAGDPQRRSTAARALVADGLLSDAEVYCAVALGVTPRTMSPRERAATALAVDQTLHFVHETSTASVAGAALEDGLGALVFPRPVVVPRLTRILERPQLAGVRAGIGPLVTLDEVHTSFERARLAWRATCLAGDDLPIVLPWQDAGLDGTLARLPLEDFTLADLPPLAHELLVRAPGRDLVVTLEQYLAAGCDAQLTARRLRIHRSTLYYRLDKVRALTSGDLGDGVVRRELHTGLRMAKLAGLGPYA